MSGALAKKLESLRLKGALNDADVAEAVGAEPASVSGWESGRLFPEVETEKVLVELEYIVELLADFYKPDEARRWLYGPQRLLAGAVPIALVQQGKIDEVLRLVGQLRELVYF